MPPSPEAVPVPSRYPSFPCTAVLELASHWDCWLVSAMVFLRRLPLALEYPEAVVLRPDHRLLPSLLQSHCLLPKVTPCIAPAPISHEWPIQGGSAVPSQPLRLAPLVLGHPSSCCWSG